MAHQLFKGGINFNAHSINTELTKNIESKNYRSFDVDVSLGPFQMWAKVLKVNFLSTEIERDILSKGAFSNVFLAELEDERFVSKMILYKNNSDIFSFNHNLNKVLTEYSFFKIVEALEVGPKLHRCYSYDLIA